VNENAVSGCLTGRVGLKVSSVIALGFLTSQFSMIAAGWVSFPKG